MRNPERETVFRFKHFHVRNSQSAMKVGTDGVLVGAWASPINAVSPCHILDIGAGTGLIALMMAQRFPSACVDAVEIDHIAALEAQQNFTTSPWSNRVSLHCCDVSEYSTDKRYQLIVSNPPFFTNGIGSAAQSRAVARHTGSLPFSALMKSVSQFLAPDGMFAMISPLEALEALEAEACLHHLYLYKECRVFTVEGKPCRRVLTAWSKNIVNPLHEQLLIHHNGEYSPQYKTLTADFYLNF